MVRPSSSDDPCLLRSSQESNERGHQIAITGHVCRRVYSLCPHPQKPPHHPHLIPLLQVITEHSCPCVRWFPLLFKCQVVRGLQLPEVTHDLILDLGPVSPSVLPGSSVLSPHWPLHCKGGQVSPTKANSTLSEHGFLGIFLNERFPLLCRSLPPEDALRSVSLQ